MQDNTTHVMSSRATTMFHGPVLEEAAFHTQIPGSFFE
jgi:hypothetical protein